MKAHAPTVYNIRNTKLHNPDGLVTLTVKQITDICENYFNDEWKQHSDEVFRNCKIDVSAQILSVVLTTLASSKYGWKKKRLNEFLEAVNSHMSILNNPEACFGKELTTSDTIAEIQKNYAINCDRVAEKVIGELK